METDGCCDDEVPLSYLAPPPYCDDTDDTDKLGLFLGNISST